MWPLSHICDLIWVVWPHRWSWSWGLWTMVESLWCHVLSLLMKPLGTTSTPWTSDLLNHSTPPGRDRRYGCCHSHFSKEWSEMHWRMRMMQVSRTDHVGLHFVGSFLFSPLAFYEMIPGSCLEIRILVLIVPLLCCETWISGITWLLWASVFLSAKCWRWMRWSPKTLPEWPLQGSLASCFHTSIFKGRRNVD